MSDAPRFLLPDLTEETAPFWEGTARGELLVQRCDGCGRLRFPPRPACPWCRSFQSTWERMSGRATLWSWAVPHPPLLPAYAEIAPYVSAVVALDEDPTIRMVGMLEGDPEVVGFGGAVEVVFPEPVDDVVLPRWVPA
jgi:uncharacterized OB-fold protein